MAGVRARQLDYVLDFKVNGPKALGDEAVKRKRFVEGDKEVQQVLVDYPTESISDEQAERLKDVSQWYGEYAAGDAAAVAAYAKGTPAGIKLGDQRIDEVRPAIVKALEIGDAMIMRADSQVRKYTAETSDGVNSGKTRLLVSVLVIGSMLILLGALIARQLLRQVGGLKSSLDALGEGDLTVAPAVTTKDEIGQMAAVADRARTSMRAVITQVAGTTDQVKTSIEELGIMVDELRQNAYSGGEDRGRRPASPGGRPAGRRAEGTGTPLHLLRRGHS